MDIQKDNQFIVDLGELTLSDDQRKSINAAIQKAVAGELANIDTGQQIAIFPRTGAVGYRIPGPILWGIIAKPVDEKYF